MKNQGDDYTKIIQYHARSLEKIVGFALYGNTMLNLKKHSFGFLYQMLLNNYV